MIVFILMMCMCRLNQRMDETITFHFTPLHCVYQYTLHSLIKTLKKITVHISLRRKKKEGNEQTDLGVL